MSLVTPLNRVLGLGNAHGAAEHWWVQRLTAVALIPLALWFAVGLASLPDFSYATVAGWVHRPVTSILLILFVGAAAYHSFLGVQVVIEDYVHGQAAKLTGLLLNNGAHLLALAIGLYALAQLALRGAP
jgi:succinate dehydrogenase / fumarate reductase membrane anchor subunit